MIPTPVLFLIFNRPILTTRVFDAIRAARPAQLFVAADGPREEAAEDVEKCRATRAIVQSGIDWDCEVRYLFRDKNLGCKVAVSSAIDWFFSHVERGIVLEDDCLPDPSFFSFCETLLEYYKDREDVMHISGDNFQNGIRRSNGSYYFSGITHVWGWATWRRAWSKYDVNMSGYPLFKRKGIIKKYFSTWIEQCYYLRMLDKVFKGEINTWDFQWNYAAWNHGGKAILPNENLVYNIGFGAEATHTSKKHTASMVPQSVSLSNIAHPDHIEINKEADRYYFRHAVPWQVKVKSIVGI